MGGDERAGAAPQCLPMPRAEPAGTHARIHAVVSRIPRGRVATYGRVAELVGLPGGARQAG